jgi:hypothetical protein
MTSILKPETAAIADLGETWDEARARARGSKDFSEHLHPRDAEGRFAETGGVRIERDGESPEIRAFNQDGQEIGRLHLDRDPATLRMDVSWVESREPGTATRLAEEYHRVHPDAILQHRTFTSEEGRAWAESMVERYPSWNVIAMAASKDFTERLHPRDPHGRFAEVGGLGDTALRSGGFSLSLAGDQPDTGWMVSQYGTERSVSIESLASEQPMEAIPGNPWHTNIKNEIDRFVTDHGDDLRQPNSYLGGWVDGGRLYLDVSHNIQDEDEAMRYARDNHQLAAYNAGTGEYVEFEQQRAASRGPEPVAKSEKVLLTVDEDTDLDELTTRLMRALFE